MSGATLPLPPEPEALKTTTRTLLEQSPEAGLQLLAEGKWIATPLWDQWKGLLKPCGMRRKQFRAIVIDYRNELRLWVMGERPWEHCVAGLAGRVTRRTPAPVEKPKSRVKEAGPRSKAKSKPDRLRAKKRRS